MTRDEMRSAIATYRSGLETELALLAQLQKLAAVQRELSEANDMAALAGAGDERARLMASLVAVEHQIKPVREAIAGLLDLASTCPGFEEVAALHRVASRMVATILSSDRDTLKALSDAEAARRAAARAIEKGETTLAAYRRVIAPPVASAAIVNRRG